MDFHLLYTERNLKSTMEKIRTKSGGYGKRYGTEDSNFLIWQTP